jgi:hypothetical protein
MFDSVILDVAIGLILTFLSVSLISGLITEVLATMMSWRANTLLDGVKALVNDPKFTGLARTLYQHSLVNPRDDGQAKSADQIVNKPSYIDPLHFADALLDNVKVVAGTATDMKTAIAASPVLAGDNQMTTLLTGMADRANGDLNAMRTAVAKWFDSGMDRVSGDYKRRTQVWCFAIGLGIAIVFNVDTLQVAKATWQQPQITRSIKASADAESLATEIQGLPLPIGWDASQVPDSLLGGVARILGWLITALSTLFGATFWFDALSGILKIRGSGPSPDDKKPATTTVVASLPLPPVPGAPVPPVTAVVPVTPIVPAAPVAEVGT